MSSDDARALHRELSRTRDVEVFLDTEDLEDGARFPPRLIDALLGSNIVVVFAEPGYFRRWYCLLEWDAAIAPFSHLARTPGVDSGDRAQSLESLVLARPAGATVVDDWNLPPELQRQMWPTPGDAVALASLVRQRLSSHPPTLAERLDATVGTARFRRQWIESSGIPPVQEIPSSVPRAPIGTLPQPLHERFVGRADDLWRIHHALAPQRGRGRTAAIEGGAGFGKSRLAIEYLHRFGSRHYPGGLFWIDAETPLVSQHFKILKALDSTAGRELLSDESDALKERLIQAFQALSTDRPALVVVDNVPEPGPGGPPPPIEAWFPGIGESSVLMTSRHRISAAEGHVIPLPLDVLDAAAAQTLLASGINGAGITDRDWQAIITWVGALPLALVLLNRALTLRAFTFHELLARSKATGTTETLDRAMTALGGRVRRGELRGATDALLFSYERLPDRVQQAIRLLAWLAPAPIPEVLIEAIGDDLVDHFARAEIVGRSLVTETPGGAVPLFGSMHRVLADFLRTQVVNVEEELVILTMAFQNVVTPQRLNTSEEWPLIDACAPHADSLLAHLESQQTASRARLLAVLASVKARYMLATGKVPEAYELAWEQLPSILVETEPDTFNTDPSDPAVRFFLETIPPVFAAHGDYDNAIALQRGYLEWIQSVDPDPEGALIHKDNLGDYLRRRGQPEDLDAARIIFGETIPVWNRHDPGSIQALTAQNNLALVLERQGDHTSAVAMFKEVIAGLERLPGVELQIITTLRSLGHSLLGTDPVAARHAFQQAVDRSDRMALPAWHPMKLDLLRQLDTIARQTREWGTARALMLRAVGAVAAKKGDRHPETTDFAFRLYAAERWLGDEAAAARCRAQYLDWLLVAPAETLDEDQEKVLATLRDVDAAT